jgi:hypothetical protein
VQSPNTLNPADPRSLKANCFTPSNYKVVEKPLGKNRLHILLLSNFNLYRYVSDDDINGAVGGGEVGLCTLNQVDP